MRWIYTSLGCQMVEKSSTCGIAKRSPRKIVSPSVFLITMQVKGLRY